MKNGFLKKAVLVVVLGFGCTQVQAGIYDYLTVDSAKNALNSVKEGIAAAFDYSVSTSNDLWTSFQALDTKYQLALATVVGGLGAAGYYVYKAKTGQPEKGSNK